MDTIIASNGMLIPTPSEIRSDTLRPDDPFKPEGTVVWLVVVVEGFPLSVLTALTIEVVETKPEGMSLPVMPQV
jgi:hypothetical protein